MKLPLHAQPVARPYLLQALGADLGKALPLGEVGIEGELALHIGVGWNEVVWRWVGGKGRQVEGRRLAALLAMQWNIGTRECSPHSAQQHLEHAANLTAAPAATTQAPRTLPLIPWCCPPPGCPPTWRWSKALATGSSRSSACWLVQPSRVWQNWRSSSTSGRPKVNLRQGGTAREWVRQGEPGSHSSRCTAALPVGGLGSATIRLLHARCAGVRQTDHLLPWSFLLPTLHLP